MQRHTSSTPESPSGFVQSDRLDGAADVTDIDTIRALLVQARQERDEANHRIANNLQRAISLLRAQRRRLTAESADYVLLSAEMRLTCIAQLHQRLGAGENTSPLRLDSFLAEVCKDLGLILNVVCDLHCDPVVVDGYTASQIMIIISELATNAVKHAYDGREGERIVIRCTQNGSTLKCLVADNGAGFPEDFDAKVSPGLGLAVVVQAVEQLGGTGTAHNADGAVFMWEVPLPQIG